MYVPETVRINSLLRKAANATEEELEPIIDELRSMGVYMTPTYKEYIQTELREIT